MRRGKLGNSRAQKFAWRRSRVVHTCTKLDKRLLTCSRASTTFIFVAELWHVERAPRCPQDDTILLAARPLDWHSAAYTYVARQTRSLTWPDRHGILQCTLAKHRVHDTLEAEHVCDGLASHSKAQKVIFAGVALNRSKVVN